MSTQAASTGSLRPDSTSASSPQHQQQQQQYAQEPVAIVGMACRLPGDSNSPHALWQFLQQNGVARTEPPPTRFNLAGHHDGSDKPTTLRNPGGMFLENVDPADFDAGFFNVSRIDAVSMDPQQRQLLEVVYEGLESAGIPIETLWGARYGCFVGSYEVDYAWMHARDPQNRPPSCAIGVGRSIMSNRISHFLNIKGPSITLDTACSGSLVGVDVACRYLQTREISGAIVAGANMYINPEHSIENGALRNAHSKSGKCHTFDAKADGYIKAEAINAVILKRLDDAIRDGDPIRAVIRGTSNNHNGRTPGIASPSSEDQAAAIRAAYRNAGISDYSLTSYFECHGTGTSAGDPIEMKGIASVFGSSRPSDKPLAVGSIKSNIGHSEPAAGISGLLKAVLTIEHGTIPGNPTFETPNPSLNFEELRLRPSRIAIPFPTDAPFRRASVNSFGFGGSNCHAIVDEPKALIPNFTPAHTSSIKYVEDEDDFFSDDSEDDDEEAAAAATRRPYLLLLSANDAASLQTYAGELSKHLSNLSVRASVRDLAHTLAARRSHHFHRAFAVARGRPELDAGALVSGKKAASPPTVGLVFTGQGAQWPRMGADLLAAFPVARAVVKRLDAVLQNLPTPPPWSLYEELTAPRTAEHLRQPEFSQPLVTALQLAVLAVLRSWGVVAKAVVGHSSGEIAAACAAGRLAEGDAIVVAYHRGLAAKNRQQQQQQGDGEQHQQLGMLAVGVGADHIDPFLSGVEGVAVACHNSPKSLTLSGVVSALEEVRERLVAKGHFARMLQVSLAYHSSFMDEIGKEYESLLRRDVSCNPPAGGPSNVTMYSSVYGKALEEGQATDVAYWKSNMVSPVRFDDAFRAMVQGGGGKAGVDFVIEVGPAAALKGPITQIMEAVEAVEEGGGNKAALQYCSALKRGADAVDATLDAAGQLWLRGVPLDLLAVNADEGSSRPLVITDLPAYAWNHATKYWFECSESREWRRKRFPCHDLLGTKVLGTRWAAPSFKRVLRLQDVPWLRDHRVGSDVVMPAAGYVAMAVEAMFQTHVELHPDVEVKTAGELCYRVRNIRFDKALVVDEDVPAEYVLALHPLAGTKGNSWFEFRVSSNKDGAIMEHVSGMIRVDEPVDRTATPSEIAPLTHTTPGHLWYKASSEVGYAFGPAFQKQTLVETRAGQRQSRSHVDLSAPASAHSPQSPYPIHPAALDGCFQAASPAIWAGGRSTMNAVLIPAVIDDLIINPVPSTTTSTGGVDLGVAVASAEYSGRGRPEVAKNYKANCRVFDPQTGRLLMQMSGLACHQLDVGADLLGEHVFMRSVVKPDLALLSSRERAVAAAVGEEKGVVQGLLDLAAHKKPALSVLEVNLAAGDSTSMWFEGEEGRDAYAHYALVAADARDLVAVQNTCGTRRGASFGMLDIGKTDLGAGATGFDFVVVKTRNTLVEATAAVLSKAKGLLADEDGRVLVVEMAEEVDDTAAPASSNLTSAIKAAGFASSLELPCSEDSKAAAHLCIPDPAAAAAASTAAAEPRDLHIVHLSPSTHLPTTLRAVLATAGWRLPEHVCPSVSSVPAKATVLILDELFESVLPSVSAEQWSAVKQLVVAQGCRLLWVTQGAYAAAADGGHPERAMATGLFRTVRAEDPGAHVVTLDVESAEGEETDAAIADVLALLQGRERKKTGHEGEFMEKGGVLHVERIVPDAPVNAAVKRAAGGGGTDGGEEPALQRLHDVPTVARLRAERIGTFEGLRWTQMSATEAPVEAGKVELEILASGLNFKDIAVTMGIVPENEHLLGLEGAGVVRRLSAAAEAAGFRVGDRVVTIEKGLLANRIQAPVKRVVKIPEGVSFEEAATMPVVYATALYAICDVGRLRRGQSVLVHSSAGGLGIASIQLAKYIGAEIYVTVSTDAKRQFLQEKFGIQPDHMFSSRDAKFGPAIMSATKGKGVDLIINSLTGDLLDASWRITADGGTMVELGKRDIVERGYLSMEPFDRNCSFRAVDISYSKHITDDVYHDLLTRVFDLVRQGHVGPIAPITTFSYAQILEAFAYMRSGRHIGKIVITDGPDGNAEVPVRPFDRAAQQGLHTLRPDVAYLIVGGLKGLCGSLAIHMARRGAKHIIAMSRSGCGDERSQGVVLNCAALGCAVHEARGDVANMDDVRAAFNAAGPGVSVAGVVQGSMVLRDKPFEAMTAAEWRECVACKVDGTWNLHRASLEQHEQRLDFFTLLSSVSGVVGNKGQANYAAANTFLDAFAKWRRDALGLVANSVNLGVIQDVGYVAEQGGMEAHLGGRTWTVINEKALHRVLDTSIAQQDAKACFNSDSAAQLVTGIACPQTPEDSDLLGDARFAALFLPSEAGGAASASASGASSAEVQAFLALRRAGAGAGALLPACLEAVGKQLARSLRLSEQVEPGKPLSAYGLDSLSAVEVRNWVRAELGAEVTTLEIINAASLVALGERILGKLVGGGGKE